MRGIQILSAPLAIVIDDEPLDGVDRGDWPVVSADGFELIPAWRSRPAGRRRRVRATLPALGVAAAVALSVGRGQDAAPMRSSSARPVAPAGPALVYRRRKHRRPTLRACGDDRLSRCARCPVLTQTSSSNGRAPADTATARRRRLPRSVRAARTTRRLARVPSRIAIGALLVLAAVGVKATVAPRTASVSASAAPATDGRDITAQGFAQAFARAPT
jgi:hypothetical protein